MKIRQAGAIACPRLVTIPDMNLTNQRNTLGGHRRFPPWVFSREKSSSKSPDPVFSQLPVSLLKHWFLEPEGQRRFLIPASDVRDVSLTSYQSITVTSRLRFSRLCRSERSPDWSSDVPAHLRQSLASRPANIDPFQSQDRSVFV